MPFKEYEVGCSECDHPLIRPRREALKFNNGEPVWICANCRTILRYATSDELQNLKAPPNNGS